MYICVSLSMEVEEALKKIRSVPKWYSLPNKNESAVIEMARRIEEKRCSVKNMVEFFKLFGYTVKIEVKWKD